MENYEMGQLRNKMDDINLELLKLINERARLVQKIGDIKQQQGMKRFDPVRERDMLNHILNYNTGPFDNGTIEHLFNEIFKAGLELLEEDNSKALLVSRQKKHENTIIHINEEKYSEGERHTTTVTDTDESKKK